MSIRPVTEETTQPILGRRIEENLSTVEEQPGALATAGAGIIRLNPYVSGAYFGYDEQPALSLQQGQVVNNNLDPNYDFSFGVTGTQYSPYMSQFANTTNEQQKAALKIKLDKEQELNDVIARGGGLSYFIGSVVGSLLDPISLIPAVSIYKEAKLASAAANAAITSATFAGVIGAQEAALHTSQTLRTADESEMNILGGAAIGGILGGAIGYATSKAIATNKQIITDILKGQEPVPATDLSIGAARAEQISPESTQIAPIVPNWLHSKYPDLAHTLDKYIVKGVGFPWFKSPVLENIVSEDATLRELTTNLFTIPLKLKGQIAKDGYAGTRLVEPMEAKLWSDSVATAKVVQNLEDIHTNYYQSLSAKKEKPLKLADFNKEVYRAWNNGDISKIPEAAAASKMIRAEVDKTVKKLVEARILSEETGELIRTGDAMRVYDVDKIRSMRSAFRDRLEQHFLEKGGVEVAELQSKLDETINTILGIGEGQIAMSDMVRTTIDSGARFTKPRTLDVPNSLIEDFLIPDAAGTFSLFTDQANKMLRFYEALNNMGHNSLSDLRKSFGDKLNESRIALRDKIYKGKGTKEELDAKFAKASAKLDESTSDAVNKANDIIEMMLGQFGHRTKIDKGLKLFKSLNYATMLGWVTLTSVVDLAMAPFKHGFARTGNTYFKLAKGLVDGTANMTKRDLDAMGQALELAQNNVLKQVLDPDFNQGLKISRVDRANEAIAEGMSTLSGIKYWNYFGKHVAGLTAQTRIMDDVLNYAKLSAKEKTYLNEVYIGEKEAAMLAKEFNTKGGHGSIPEWSPEARQLITSAVQREIRSTIITPGKGSTPAVVQKYQAVALMFQFKAFFADMTGKVLLRGLQSADANTFQGVMAMMALGAGQYIVSERLKGRNPDTSTDKLILESINRSGMLGLLGDPLFSLILNNSGRLPSRLQTQNKVNYIMGPSASTLQHFFNIFNDLKGGIFDDKTKKEAWRLVPYNNLFYIQLLLGK